MLRQSSDAWVCRPTHPCCLGRRPGCRVRDALQGKTYLEILEAGGGILSTVAATRAASLEQLVEETRPRLQSMFRHGATTIEAKTGYGLDFETETRMLEALLVLDDEGPWELAFTFFRGTRCSPEYADKGDEYTSLIVEDMLPDLKAWWSEKAGVRTLPFVDVFLRNRRIYLRAD